MKINTTVNLDNGNRRGNYAIVIEDWKGAGRYGVVEQVGETLADAITMTSKFTLQLPNHKVTLIELPYKDVFDFLMKYMETSP